jgi:hypothetical protein
MDENYVAHAEVRFTDNTCDLGGYCGNDVTNFVRTFLNFNKKNSFLKIFFLFQI